MWPFERKMKQEYLRIGRHTLERWSGPATKLSLVAQQTLPADIALATADLPSLLHNLYSEPPAVGITVLFESAWLPVLLLEVGDTLWTPAQVQPLLRHRLHSLHDNPQGAPTDWELRLDYVAGQRFALGYGMPQQIRLSLAAAAQTLGLRWAAVLPAFGWGLQHLRPVRSMRRGPDRTGWWVWPEQDRLLLARIEGRGMVSLHPGLAFTDNPQEIERMVAIESARAGGIASHAPIRVASWSSEPRPGLVSDQLEWCSITAAGLPPSTRFTKPAMGVLPGGAKPWA